MSNKANIEDKELEKELEQGSTKKEIAYDSISLGGMTIDFNKKGCIVGLEVFNFSQQADTDKINFEDDIEIKGDET